ALEPLTGAGDETESAALAELVEKLHSFTGEEHLDFVLRDIDVESLIEYQAVKCLISDEDGFTKNWLLFHGRKKGAGPGAPALWTAHPWDLDLSFGQIDLFSEDFFTNKHPLLGTVAHPREGRTWNGLLEAVFGGRSGDYFVKALHGRIWGLLDEKFNSRALGPKIDWLDSSTIDEARLDLERWPRWGSDPTDPGPHRDRLREYVIARGRFLRRFLTSENRTTRDPASSGPFRSFRYTPAPRLRITEIHYRPSVDEDLEFLEVRNLEERRVDLTGWSIPAVEFLFPSGSEAEPLAHFLVARRPEKLAAARGGLAGVRIFGPYEGRLANEGEEVRLRDSGIEGGRRFHPETIDVVKYRDQLPWPPGADGKGKSLELIDITLDNDRPGSWRASRKEGGSPEGD
ncbi:MAG TPA: CotH kinase family protein, partial [Planctomycetota bacterium]|nr:CotH kinase family protein [Planctomycetota bacterium]